MQLLQPPKNSPLKLRLSRNLTRLLKRGHPWVFADALREHPSAPPGAHAVLLDNKGGREIARGFYDSSSLLAFRVCSLEAGWPLNERWAQAQFQRALALRQALFSGGSRTTGYRLFNGEGDGLPGLICDLYGDTAVLQLDGAGPGGFWHTAGVARWLADKLPLCWVYERPQSRSGRSGQLLLGQPPLTTPVQFVENGVRFTADVIDGQKTGFFLDQRDNRQRVGQLAAGRRVLNLFGYTGGFSVYAGLGGAAQVTTVDLAEPALAAAGHHWELNGLVPADHRIAPADVFDFLERARREKKRWDLVIADPPSFAPSREAASQARQAYQRLVAASVAVTESDGLLAAASCSSHIDLGSFLHVCEEGVSKARRRATVLGVFGQPADHPAPLAFAEFRYLKFVLMRVE